MDPVHVLRTDGVTADLAATTPLPPGTSVAASEVRTFLFADVRGYTRFTQEHGDAAAAHLATRLASIVREGAAPWARLYPRGRQI